MSSNLKQAAKGELVFTSFLFLAALIILWDTYSIVESNVAGVIGPKVFAYAIGAMMLVLSSIQLFSVARGNLGQPEEIEGGVKIEKPNWVALAILVAGIMVHIFLLEIVGFIISGALLFFAVAWALGERRWIRLAILSAALAAIIYFVFTEGLQLDLPWGFNFSGADEAAQVEEW
ncbi:MAG: hypothetical protein F2599_02715 [Actinobacteria bacterium]|jgi:putative tricarboxylic transport membrane protein|uniref:Unannotated protein n=1 Tax=freshwater metagenome TaxID=449393 RepID=A0A6J6I1L7_9ZZZZ|nr:hypothetical protein [Actinomycetota bacterium]